MSNGIRVQEIGRLLEETIEDITIKASGVNEAEGDILSTGLLNLDWVLGGLRSGEVACIAGTSRSGRHSLACQIGLNAARQGASVLVVSAKTSARQVALRYLAADARVDLSMLEAGKLDEDGCDALMFLDRSLTPEEGAGADTPDFGKAIVSVARNRHGACCIVRLAFVREYGCFLDLVDDADA